MAKDAVATMGSILPDDVGGRDAVHVAVIAVTASEDLTPGQDIGLTGDIALNGTLSRNGDQLVGVVPRPIGIVDPFLTGLIHKGDRFWMYLYPRTITGLAHHWTHPAFDGDSTSYAPPRLRLASEKWIDDWASQYGLRASIMIEKAREYKEHGDYFSMGGTFEGESVPDEFWDHYERVTGEMVEDADRGSFFSCSC